MLNKKYREKLLSRFPYLFLPEQAATLLSNDPSEVARAERRLLESVLRLLGGLFLRQVLVHGAADERITRFLDEGNDELPLSRWLELQRLVLEERRVPFEEVFSLDFKRRDLLLLINRRYLGYLSSLEAQLRRSGDVPAELSQDASSVFADFVEFLVTYFKSDLAMGAEEHLALVNKEGDEVLGLHPIFTGNLDNVEVFSGLSADGACFTSLKTLDVRETSDANLLARLGESFLKVGAYRQAIGTFEKLGRAQPDAPQNESALYASHCYLGLEHYRKGKFHPAIVEFEKALELRSDMPQLHYNLALSYARLNNFSRATQILTNLVEEHPEADRGYELLGDLLQMKGDRAAARRMYDKGLLSNPHNRALEQKRRRLTEGSAAKTKASAATNAGAVSSAAKAGGEEDSRIHELLIDMTEEAAEGRLRHIVGRDAELTQIMEILRRESRSNPLLIGEPGVGKTAIVEELALRLSEGRVPQPLKNTKLYLMSVATLLAGAKFRGQFEERILGLVNELKKERCILFIDDIHTIVNSGLSKGGTLDTSNLLKPALVRGEIQAIGATSFDEYRNNIEKDMSLVRCFQTVNVEEPSPELMCEILDQHRQRLGEHHGVRFEDLDLSEISRLVAICLRDRRLPDAAVTVLDRAAARVCLRGIESESEIEPSIVKRDEVVAVIAEMSGIPVTRLSSSETERFLSLDELLGERVVGQPAALEAVARVLRTTRLDLDIASHRPNGVFLFVGPTGVGKTELARATAEFLFGDDDKLIRIDMSEYMERISASRLIGTAPGYVGYNDQNQLTDQVRKQPYSLVLLDEIEKADSQMLNLFLQVFDAGRLTDGKGRTVHFNNTTIVMTSNVGTHLYGQARAGYAAGGKSWNAVGRSELEREIKRFFPPEFLNRIDEIVFFLPLNDEDLKRIAELQLRSVRERLAKQDIELSVSSEVYALLVDEGASPEYGARNLARTIRRRILDPLAHQALMSQWDRVRRIVITVVDANIEVTLRLEGDIELEAAEIAGMSDLEVQEP